MSVTLEQVEQLRAHAAVSYEEARRALEACDGDLLDALILLEREGRIPPGLLIGDCRVRAELFHLFQSH